MARNLTISLVCCRKLCFIYTAYRCSGCDGILLYVVEGKISILTLEPFILLNCGIIDLLCLGLLLFFKCLYFSIITKNGLRKLAVDLKILRIWRFSLYVVN